MKGNLEIFLSFRGCGCRDIQQMQKDITSKKFLETLVFPAGSAQNLVSNLLAMQGEKYQVGKIIIRRTTWVEYSLV